MKFRNGVLGLTLTSALALAAFSANAADIYRSEAAAGGYKDGPVYVANTWTGFYAGVNGGYAWNQRSGDSENSPEGGFGGGQIGYNWQGGLGLSNHLVLGVEADIQGAGISDTTDVVVHFPRANFAGTLDANLDYFGTVRGRIGYAFDRTLVYFTGGFAYGGVDNTVTLPHASFKNNNVETGYVLGGGLEYKFNPAWSVKAEYQYIALDNSDLTGPTGVIKPAHDQNDYNTVRVGLNYHVGQSYEPLK